MKLSTWAVSCFWLLGACHANAPQGEVSQEKTSGSAVAAVETETESAEFFDPYPPGTTGGSAVVARGSVACGKSLDGRWFCWGPNWYGIHGADVPMNTPVSATNQPTQPIAGLPGEPSDLVVGTRHACALIDNKAYCFGMMQPQTPNPSLSTGVFVSVPQPTPVEGEFTQLAAGRDFTCGIEKSSQYLNSGRVRCWGANDKGQLGVGDNLPRNAWVPQVAVGDTPGWLVSDLHRVSSIVAGDSHVCALRDAHDNRPAAYYCWGANDRGQLGIGYLSPYEARPQRINTLTQVDSTVTSLRHHKIGAYGNRTCAINWGYIFCWGDNTGGEFSFVGEGWRRFITTPSQVVRHALDFGAFRDIALGNRHQCASRVQNGINSSLVCWGSNSHNQLGADSAFADEFPVLSPQMLATDREPAQLALGDDFTCIAFSPSSHSTGNNVRCFGRNDLGQTGRGSPNALIPYPTNVRFPLKVDVPITDVAVGYYSTCAVTAMDELRCYGSNENRVLGMPDVDAFLATPSRKLSGVRFTQAPVPSLKHACAVTVTNEVYCWGDNGWGKTGQGLSYPSLIEPRKVEGLPEPVVQVINLAEASCALTVSGDAYCWGRNTHGQIGFGYYGDWLSARPSKITGKFSQLAGRGSTVCGIVPPTGFNGSLSEVQCWGDNSLGQRGRIDQNFPTHIPQAVPGVQNVKYLDGNNTGFCAVNHDGRVICWGENLSGFLVGIPGDPRMVLTATTVALPELMDQVAVGSETVCAISRGNRLYCWGLNNQLAAGSATSGDSTPRLMSGVPTGPGPAELLVKKVSLQNLSTCAVTLDERLVCWGNQRLGRLGNGVITDNVQRVPFVVQFPLLLEL